ncbi:hypothetical protein PG991_007932 [Apiospora marii]|uniref:ubiquitinyl hydrolase 1 n=1 Tax=Apiospora marii TaxID=335849 RepID=A0ABR1RV82_9PEZI
MEFAAAQEQEGWAIHFGLKKGHLVVQACKNDSTWQFIPPEALQGDLPQPLITPYQHWINVETGVLEFRPYTQPWSSGGTLWHADTKSAQTTLTRGDEVLISPKSNTAGYINDIFVALEKPEFITIILNKSTAELEIGLPRYDLTFHLMPTSSSLRCRKYPGMCIDSVQTVRSLIGLQSKLVLCPLDSGSSRRKAIIVPRGRPEVQRYRDSHPSITILPTDFSDVETKGCEVELSRHRHHYYEIDDLLGRFIDSGSLQSKLLLCHLHAVTSHCLIDPLTSRTGTEEALRILKSAAVMSFSRLEPDEAELLLGIAKLSPEREFYPDHLMEMQQIEWNDTICPLAQNDEFGQVVESIFKQSEACEIYFSPEKSLHMPSESNAHLRSRALIRNSTYRVDGFGAEFFTESRDQAYQSRATIRGSSTETKERQLCHITKTVLSERANLVEVLPDVGTLVSWIYSTLSTRASASQTNSPIPYGEFDLRWLGDPEQVIGENWRGIYNYICANFAGWAIPERKFKLMAFFGALIYSPHAKFELIQLLVALAYSTTVDGFVHPPYQEPSLRDGRAYNESKILSCIERRRKGFHETPDSKLPQGHDESKQHLKKCRQEEWDSKTRHMMRSFATELSKQFPTCSPRRPMIHNMDRYFDVEKALRDVRALFQTWSRNFELYDYFSSIVQATSELPRSPHHVASCRFTFHSLPKASPAAHITANMLFAERSPQIRCAAPDTIRDLTWQSTTVDERKKQLLPSRHNLQPLIESLEGMVKDSHKSEYVEELRRGFERHQAIGNSEYDSQPVPNADVRHKRLQNLLIKRLQNNLSRCLQQVESFQESIFRSFDDQGSQLMSHSRHFFPRLSPMFVLQQLNRHHWPNLPGSWRSCVTQYALSLTHLQRAQRMVSAVGNKMDLKTEAANVGHSWDLEKFPESLLMEVESGLIIRDIQEEVAGAMREPNGNRVMQLNMGEGKSSVIVQMVAAYLADGNRLVRIIVAKPQSKQSRHMLVTKLGGLLDRRVFFLPFSRSIVMDRGKVAQIQSQLELCRKTGGVLLVQPEELLSFKLMGIEYVGSQSHSLARPNDPYTGRKLIDTQKYLEKYSRDIIDESDENFSVKFELVYTIGTQRPSEMSPDRWIVIQHVLTLIARFAPEIGKLQPGGVQLQNGYDGQFAQVRFLREDAGHMLLQAVARHLCDNGCHRLPVSRQSQATRDLIFAYITQFDVDRSIATRVEDAEGGFFDGMTKDVILLLRGLFAHGILAFAFGHKRWKVNYGLTTRVPPTMLAVPYRAKDAPAPRSEWSHPDVAIMDTAFDCLERSDQALAVYGDWVANSPSLAPAFRQLSGVNRRDRSQCLEQVFPALRHTKAVVDFYLGKVVFPKECLEFPSKLSASGWDLAKPRPEAVTGFSGTCDSKYVLPVDISHVDLPSQSHTNAMVLDNLLRPENKVEYLGSEVNSEKLLAAVVNSDKPIQVILDVGALIVDLGNEEVARRWLELTPSSDKEAVIFLNRDDEMLVMDRNGFVEPFLTSSFVANTDTCLVFLDEAHTRGIDLKLPDHYRAAVTLGPRLTKDRLTQACMRLRKLGKGQSVTFFVPKEVRDKIKAVFPRHHLRIQVLHVLCWSIAETWADIHRSIPLWASQGLRHQRQEVIWEDKVNGRASSAISKSDLEDYFEDEGLSLEQRYRPAKQNTTGLSQRRLARFRSSGRSAQVKMIEDKCERFGVANLTSASIQEEQERELAPETEMELERQAERMVATNPAEHSIHHDVLHMVEHGELRLWEKGFEGAFLSIRRFTNLDVSQKLMDGFRKKPGGETLLVTSDFAQTVVSSTWATNAFLRPVQWVLTFKNPRPPYTMVILSPYEANKLLPLIEKSPHVFLHMYLPRSNLAMPSLQDLQLYTTPALPPDWKPPQEAVMRLNLFAGQLYFDAYEDYKRTCEFLGLSYVPNRGDTAVSIDGFVGQKQYRGCSFKQSPTVFLQFTMSTVRHNRQDISKTHVGRMLAGEILIEADFQRSF